MKPARAAAKSSAASVPSASQTHPVLHGERAAEGARRSPTTRGIFSGDARPFPPPAGTPAAPAVSEEPSPEPVEAQHGPAAEPRGRALVALSLGALGVVYGDIGTSPLYAIKECFTGRARGGAHPRQHLRGAVARLLGHHLRRHLQVPGLRHAGRQPRGGRHPRPGGAGGAARDHPARAEGAAAARALRRGAPLWRWRHHPGHQRALRGGGGGGGRAGAPRAGGARHRGHPAAPLPLPEARHRHGGRRLRAGDGAVVPLHRRHRGARPPLRPPHPGRALAPPRRALLPPQPAARLPGARSGGAGHHRW